MKTRTAFALCLGVCSLSVLLPLTIFHIQDSVAVDQDIVWQSSTEDIARNYPVVSRVYANFYQRDETQQRAEYFTYEGSLSLCASGFEKGRVLFNRIRNPVPYE